MPDALHRAWPIREKKKEIEDAFRAFLTSSKELRLLPMDLAIAERAARIRAETGMATPDAIHAATALHAEVALFLSNDPAFRRVRYLPVALLSEV